MSEIIISRLGKRIKSLETKILEIKDNYEEMDNNLEDIYDTINNIKSLDSENDSRNKFISSTNKNNLSNNLTNEKHIIKFIDDIINCKSNSHSKNDKDNKDKCIIFYNKLIKNQPQLHNEFSSIKEHITYFMDQDILERDNILSNLEKVYEITDNKIPRFFKIINSNLDAYHKKIALNKLHILETMQKTDSEYFKISQWLDTFIDIPFNIYKTPSYMNAEITNNPSKYLTDSRTHLDTVIYGQNKTKQHIIEIIAKMIRNPKTFGSVFAIYGEPGTGKTTLIKDGLSHIFGLPFIFISLGGAQDRAVLAGSNYVYEGSSCGKIIQSLKQMQCMNPIFYFDELDKISGTEKGIEIINLLIHLTDYTQNSHFMDDYMDGIAINLSRATFIFSFNDKNKISPVLLDRMEIIKFNSYSIEEKMVIAKEFLLPNIVKNVFNNDKIKIIISNENIIKIVKGGRMGERMFGMNGRGGIGGRVRVKLGKIMKTVSKKKNRFFVNESRNGGVRYIKKILEKIVSRINLKLFQNKKYKKQKYNSIIIDNEIVNDIMKNK